MRWHCGGFGDAPKRCEVALQHGKASLRADRFGERVDDFRAWRFRALRPDVFFVRAGDGERVALQFARQRFLDRGNAARFVKIDHVVFRGRVERGE